jgi:hypothetical protein
MARTDAGIESNIILYLLLGKTRIRRGGGEEEGKVGGAGQPVSLSHIWVTLCLLPSFPCVPPTHHSIIFTADRLGTGTYRNRNIAPSPSQSID